MQNTRPFFGGVFLVVLAGTPQLPVPLKKPKEYAS